MGATSWAERWWAVAGLVAGVVITVWAGAVWLQAPGENIGLAVFVTLGWITAIVFYVGARPEANGPGGSHAAEPTLKPPVSDTAPSPSGVEGGVTQMRDVGDVKSGAAAAPAMWCFVLGIGAFFGAVLVGRALPSSDGAVVLVIGGVLATVLWLAALVIAVRWVVALWRAG